MRATLDHMVLLVSDLSESAPWYDAFLPLLGFEKTRDHVYLHVDGWAVELRAAEPGTPAYGRYNPGLNHIGLNVADADTVMRVREMFAAKGFDVPEPQLFGGFATVIFFRDPDGMRWEVGYITEPQ